jgi:predicted DNA binding CopG/RHH family protein
MSKLKKLPEFKTEQEERKFWEENDSSEYFDWSKAKAVIMPNLKPSTKTISLRLPEGLLDSIKLEANKRDMPYQSLSKLGWQTTYKKRERPNLKNFAQGRRTK